jgi:hypothetical protein
MLRSSVKCLFTLRRPTTVVRRIGTVIVSTIQCHFIWRITHVGIEIFEAVEPLFADRDASASIVFVRPDLWVGASCLHRFPTAIGASVRLSSFWISAFAMFEAMLSLTFQASARFIATAKTVTKGNTFVSAITSAEPTGISIWTLNTRKDGQAYESLTCKIFECWHFMIMAEQKLMVKLI